MRGAILIVTILAACSATRVEVVKGPEPLFLRVGSAVEVDAQAPALTLHFHERTFVFPKGFSSFKGSVGASDLHLSSGSLDVRLSNEEVRVVRGAQAVVKKLSEFPPGSRIVYADDRLQSEP